MKSELELLEEVLAKKLTTILELEIYIDSMSVSASSSFGSLGVGIETLANAQIALDQLKSEQRTLEKKHKLLCRVEQKVQQGTKEEILEVLEKMPSDNSVFKLIKLAGNDSLPKES